MFSEETLKRLRERAPSDFDIRDLLIEYDRLTKALTERRPLGDVDPTGGISQDERAARREAAYRPSDS